jgi:hypothetical protein
MTPDLATDKKPQILDKRVCGFFRLGEVVD